MKKGRKRKKNDHKLLFDIAIEKNAPVQLCTEKGIVIRYFYIQNVTIEGNIETPDMVTVNPY